MLQLLRDVNLVLVLSLRNAFRYVFPKLVGVLGPESKDEEAIDLDLPVDYDAHIADRSGFAIVAGDGTTRLMRTRYRWVRDGTYRV